MLGRLTFISLHFLGLLVYGCPDISEICKKLERPFSPEIDGILREQVAHTYTRHLWDAILLQIEQLKKLGIELKIGFFQNEGAGEVGDYSTDYFLKKTDKAREYLITINYFQADKTIFRTIISYSPGHLIFSALQIPSYICFAHELCHVLNILEYLSECSPDERDALLEQQEDVNKKRTENIRVIRKFLSTKLHFDWSISKEISEQESLWGADTSLDDLSVILGIPRKLPEKSFEILGETIFVRDHYPELSSKINFFCWTHEVLDADSLSSLQKKFQNKELASVWYQILRKTCPSAELMFSEISRKRTKTSLEDLPIPSGCSYEFVAPKRLFGSFVPPRLNFKVDDKVFCSMCDIDKNTIRFPSLGEPEISPTTPSSGSPTAFIPHTFSSSQKLTLKQWNVQNFLGVDGR